MGNNRFGCRELVRYIFGTHEILQQIIKQLAYDDMENKVEFARRQGTGNKRVLYDDKSIGFTFHMHSLVTLVISPFLSLLGVELCPSPPTTPAKC